MNIKHETIWGTRRSCFAERKKRWCLFWRGRAYCFYRVELSRFVSHIVPTCIHLFSLCKRDMFHFFAVDTFVMFLVVAVGKCFFHLK